jgi:hypothetical protein
MYRALLVSAALCLVFPAASPAAKVKVWHRYSADHYEKARLKNAVLSTEGTLRLSRQLKPLAKLDANHVWDLAEDQGGNLYVATGDEGRIYKVNAAGKVSVAYAGEDSQVLSLAVGADGSIYAGTGPHGQVIRIQPGEPPQVIARDLGKYVWCLAVDPTGQTLYAGTGPRGRIYKLSSEGKAQVFYTTKQDHILSLAVGRGGRVYAGVDKKGLVYRIDNRGKGFVLYQAAQAEIRSLLVTADGIYAGTSVPTRRHGGGSSATSVNGLPTTGRSGVRAMPASRKKGAASGARETAVSSSLLSDSSDSDKSTSASSIPSAKGGENSVYLIRPDGTVREFFREKAMVLSMLRQNGRFFVGTGMDGQLFEVDEVTRERSEIARLDHGQIHRLLRRQDGSIVLGTGDPGKLYVLQDRFAAQGSVVSEVLDAKIISKWGSLRWQADVPKGTAVSVAVRSGNVAEPDDTWSDWSEEQTDGQQATVTAPTARYLQYRIRLASENPLASPAVRSLALRYMTTNQAPEVNTVEVPDLDAANLDNPKKIKIKWTATDPNEDELTYSLYVRKEGWKNWVLLEENLDKKEFEWDTTTTPSGLYRARVVATDRKDNPASEALTGEKLSAAFAVAHTSPTVTVKVAGMEGEQVVIEATATDPLVRLTEASFAVNGKRWTNVFPVDGLFDSKQEQFRFTTKSLKPGTYVLVLRVRDAAGNTGSADVVFTVRARGGQ